MKWSEVAFKELDQLVRQLFHQLFFWHYLAIRYQKAIFPLFYKSWIAITGIKAQQGTAY